MRKWYEKYKDWIVVLLFLLFGLKGCQSCSRERALEWNRGIYEYKMDSLDNLITAKNDSLRLLDDSIHMYKFILNRIEDDNKRLVESNRQIQRNNSILINTNNRIINKVEKEDEKSK